jgi:hypothetical protein
MPTGVFNQQRAVPRAEVGCELGSNLLIRSCEGAAILSSQESFVDVPSNLLFTAFADNCRYIPNYTHSDLQTPMREIAWI